LVYIAEYTGWPLGAAFLLCALSRNRRQEVRGALAVFLLGLSLEYLQHLIYHNAMEWWDVRDDALAILAAFTIYHLTRSCYRGATLS
jgi:hypothetical protein